MRQLASPRAVPKQGSDHSTAAEAPSHTVTATVLKTNQPQPGRVSLDLGVPGTMILQCNCSWRIQCHTIIVRGIIFFGHDFEARLSSGQP